MDVSLVAAILAQQQGAIQSQIATSALKQDLNTQKDSVLTLLGSAQQSLANVGPGIGDNLNISV
jgi:Putative motility protein